MAYTDFVRAGFPVISIIGFVLCLVLVLFSSRASPLFGNGQPKAGGLPVLACCVYLFLISCAMVFTGPSSTVRNAIQLFVVSVSGTFAVLSGHRQVHQFFLIFSIYTFLCALGVMPLFGFTEIISQISSLECNAYFATLDAAACADMGYLMFIRVVTAIGLYVLLISLVLSTLAYSSINGYDDGSTSRPSGAVIVPSSSRGVVVQGDLSSITSDQDPSKQAYNHGQGDNTHQNLYM